VRRRTLPAKLAGTAATSPGPIPCSFQAERQGAKRKRDVAVEGVPGQLSEAGLHLLANAAALAEVLLVEEESISPVKRSRSLATMPCSHSMAAASAAQAADDGKGPASSSFSLRGRKLCTSAKVAAALMGSADDDEEEEECCAASRKRRPKRCGGKRGVATGGVAKKVAPKKAKAAAGAATATAAGATAASTSLRVRPRKATHPKAMAVF
jgi:hypothetical protein